MVIRGGGWALVAFLLAGCTSTPHATPAHTPPPVTAVRTASTNAAAADLGSCRAYHRQAGVDDAKVREMLTHPTDPGEIEQTFMVMAGNLESDSPTAHGSALVTALRGTVAGLRQSQAIANAWTDGSSLDLYPGVDATYKASSKVAEICSSLDRGMAYTPIGTMRGTTP